MASEVIDVTGIARYAKVFESNRDMGSKPDAKYQYDEATTIQLILDQEELMKVTRANPKIKPMITEHGLEVKFRRKWHNSTNPKWGGPPVIKDADGNPWPNDKYIGNGSKVRVAAEVYDTQYGKAMRLMGLQVLEYVEPDFPSAPDLPF